MDMDLAHQKPDSAPRLRLDLAHIQFTDVTTALTVEQSLSKALDFVLAFLEKAQTGADHFTRGPVAPTAPAATSKSPTRGQVKIPHLTAVDTG